MSPRRSTEPKIDAFSALLSLAMAETPDELLAARMAVITTGGLARPPAELRVCPGEHGHSVFYGCPVAPAAHGLGNEYVPHTPLTTSGRAGILLRRFHHAWHAEVQDDDGTTPEMPAAAAPSSAGRAPRQAPPEGRP